MRLKPIIFSLCVVLGIFIALEAASAIVYYFAYSRSFSHHAVENYRERVRENLNPAASAPNSRERDMRKFTLSPFLGYVRVPGTGVTPDGFYGEEDPLVAGKDPNNVIAGIGGGSVAEFFYLDSKEQLREELKKIPAYRDKKIVIVMFGMSGYRQPQQFLAASYYLVRGGRLDLFINLDGRNEAVDGLSKAQKGIYPAYPYFWDWGFLASAGQTQAGYGDILMWKRLRQRALNGFKRVDFSITASTLWVLLDHFMAKRSAAAEAQLYDDLKEGKQPYFVTGPNTMRKIPGREVARFEVMVWESANLQLAQLAKANGFHYFHFLQPSQYVEGSKKLTGDEKINAFSLGPPAGDHDAIKLVYPMMQPRIQAMRAQGVNSYDLTGVYKDSNRTIYRDACCHVNKLGNDMLAAAMGRHIQDYFRTHQ